MKISKKIIVLIMMCVTITLAGCSKKGVDGKFEGEGYGMNGPIKVAVDMKDGKISDIKVLSSIETGPLTKDVFRILKEGIIKNQGLSIDAISGASTTSEAFVGAVSNAVVKSGAMLKDFKKVKVKVEYGDKIDKTKFDVIVVGGGGAGLSAAITAAEQGKKVVLLEKMTFLGGNTLISGGAMAVPDNELQKREGISDSNDKLYNDILKGGDYKNDPKLVRVLADNAKKSYEWLKNDIGVEYEDHLLFFGGHSVKRSLVPKGGSGGELIEKLKKKAEKIGVVIYRDTKVVAIKKSGDKYDTVIAKKQGKEYEFKANNGIVIATGGFGSNIEMRKEYNPKMDEKILSTDSIGTTGDGIRMVKNMEGDKGNLVDMEYIQTYPTCHVETGRLLYVGDVRLMGLGILVNKDGNRFVQELERRDVISEMTTKNVDGCSYLFWDEDAMKKSKVLDLYKDEYNNLIGSGNLAKGNTLEEVAKKMGINVANFEKTVKKYNMYAKSGVDEDFHIEKRSKPVAITKAPYYIMKSKPAVHHTMGGIEINEKAQVLDINHKPIKGLYACGETTGNIHGTNRLGSVAIADIIVFGRIAGLNASK